MPNEEQNNKPNPLKALGNGLLGMIPGFLNSGIGAWFGTMMQGQQDDRQYNQEKRLQELSMANQQKMTDYNFKKQLDLWNATNYSAQLEQMKKAGLSPGLMYGGGGQGISSQITPGQVQSGNAPKGGGEVAQFMGIAQQQQQLQLLQAQKNLLEAQADKTKKEAQNISAEGIDTQVKQATIANINQGIENQKAKLALDNIQIELQKYEKEFQDKTFTQRINIFENQSEILANEVIKIWRENQIGEATREEKIKQIQLLTSKMILENTLTETQTQKLLTDMSQGWESLNIQEKKYELDNWLQHENINLNENAQIIKVLDLVLGKLGGKYLNKASKTITQGGKKNYRKPY